MLAIMTTPSTCTPAELLANLPGILGFYPRESVVFAAFEATATPHRFLLGPVLRIDVDDMSLLPEVAGSLGHIGHDLLLAFLITDGPKTATESVVDQLFSAAEEGIIDIDACWLTREILTGEPFRLAFGPAPAELTHLKATSGAWEHGHIASITDSAAIKPLLRTGNLPELHRSEAFDHYNRFNPHFDNREITALEDFAARHAADLVRRINREAAQGSGETMSTVITDFHHLLSEIRDTAGTVAEVMNDEGVLVTTAVYLSDSLLRDAVMGAAPDHHQAAMDLSLAVARTFSGTIRANALCVHAIAAVAADLSMRVIPALSAARRAVPAHTLSSLLLDGARHGVFQPMLEATVRGSEIVAEKYHALAPGSVLGGPGGLPAAEAA